MAAQRHAQNPARAKLTLEDLAEGESLNQRKRKKPFKIKLDLSGRLSVALLNILSAVLLTVAFPPFDHWYLGFVALVPWTLALSIGRNKAWALLWCFLSGVLFWAGNLYWLWWITLAGYFPLVLMMAGYWFLAGWIVRSALRRGWPAWAILPVIWVALEFARAHVLGGFPWFFLAHTQYARAMLIQIADTTGQYGVSFAVAMVAGYLSDLLHPAVCGANSFRAKPPWKLYALGTAVLAVVLGGIAIYGLVRLKQETTQPGPVVGVVQHAFPIGLTISGPSRESILQDHVELTLEQLKDKGCELVIWPETVLPYWMNDEMLDVDIDALDEPDLRSLASMVVGPDAAKDLSAAGLRMLLNIYLKTGGQVTYEGGRVQEVVSAKQHRETITSLVRKIDCPLLAGAGTGHRVEEPIDDWDRWCSRNSSLLFDREGQIVHSYAKLHLVPFGEYVPLKRQWPAVHEFLRSFVPEAMPQLEAGTSTEPFTLAGSKGRGPWRLATPICFEGTFARVCRELVYRDGRKDAQILVNMSNDGWFVWRWGEGPYRGSTEHALHLAHYCFRAVENRVPVLRSVNTGISASIDSNGRLAAVLELGEKARTMVPGSLLLDAGSRNRKDLRAIGGPQVLVDERISPYSVIGDVFAMAMSVLAAVLAVILAVRKLPPVEVELSEQIPSQPEVSES